MDKRNSDDFLNHMVAGAVSAWSTALVTCPLDVLKIRMQAGYIRSSDGLVYEVKNLIRTEGIRGFYRGLGPSLFGYLPSFSIYFPLYNWSKSYFGYENRVGGAIMAGSITNLITNPIWVLRTRLMSQHLSPLKPQLYKNSIDLLTRMIREEGFTSLYRGIGASMIGCSHVAIQFPLYDFLRESTKKKDFSETCSIIFSSIISKITAASVTYPHETIRTRLQINKGHNRKDLTIYSVIKDIFKVEGFKGFYSGIRANIVRAVPASIITFMTFENALKMLNNL